MPYVRIEDHARSEEETFVATSGKQEFTFHANLSIA